ncbi:MAG: GreA/GreB family elongation factor [Phycisphaerae bacterium]|jgi:regulator of nucleoside diphosphate kinase|nr:GreA/GreB family elongation factor [Phycisphaerae bacterium]
MKAKTIYINVEDMTRLSECLRVERMRYENESAHLRVLSEAFHHAKVVLPNQMPPDVVTVHSQVLLRDLASGEEMKCIVVFPEDADVIAGRISVVAPIGAAILGRRVGESVQVNVPAGVRRMRIERILCEPETTAMSSREVCV